jgi:hypothetical protein
MCEREGKKSGGHVIKLRTLSFWLFSKKFNVSKGVLPIVPTTFSMF